MEDEPEETQIVSNEELILRSKSPDQKKINVTLLISLLEGPKMPKTGNREAKTKRVAERMFSHYEEAFPGEGLCDIEMTTVTKS
jgi:hypothetical protein